MRAIVVIAAVLSGCEVVCGAGLEVAEALVKLIDQAEVAALEAGVLAEVAVQEGERVESSAILARLETLDAELLLRRAEDEVAIAAAEASSSVKVELASANMSAAEAELERARESIRKFPRSVSPSELARFELSFRQSQLAVEQAKHEQAVAQLTLKLRETDRAIAERQLARRSIPAPFAGMVVQLYRRPGEWVEAGEKVLRLVRTDRVRAEGFLPAQQAVQAKVGAAAKLTLASGATVVGRVTFISPELDPVTKQVRVLAEFENPRLELRPGMSGRLTIQP